MQLATPPAPCAPLSGSRLLLALPLPRSFLASVNARPTPLPPTPHPHTTHTAMRVLAALLALPALCSAFVVPAPSASKVSCRSVHCLGERA